jgi:hypothetical protein
MSGDGDGDGDERRRHLLLGDHASGIISAG